MEKTAVAQLIYGLCENITFKTVLHNNGDGKSKNVKGDGFFTTHEITLVSLGNEATIRVGDEITPENLRELANSLESFLIKERAKYERMDEDNI